jgi:hypothetical protein
MRTGNFETSIIVAKMRNPRQLSRPLDPNMGDLESTRRSLYQTLWFRLTSWLASHYKQYAKDQQLADSSLYAEAQELASINNVGLWRDPAPIPPWYFRRKRKAE